MLNKFFDEMYDQAKAGKSEPVTWMKIQELAFQDDLAELERIVIRTAKLTVRMPIIRSALKKSSFSDESGEQWSIKEGSTVILDTVSRLWSQRSQLTDTVCCKLQCVQS